MIIMHINIINADFSGPTMHYEIYTKINLQECWIYWIATGLHLGSSASWSEIKYSMLYYIGKLKVFILLCAL